MLLETVIATGLLILGLAVIGAQVQDADTSIRKMQLRLRAMMLAERSLAELDLGLVELDSVDEVQEEEYGPRYPEFGWRLTTEETSIEGMYLLMLEVLHIRQDSDDYGRYREGGFDHDKAEVLFTIYALRVNPEPLDLGEEFGMDEEEYAQLSEDLGELGIPGLDDPSAFDWTALADIDMEQFLKVLPLLPESLIGDLDSLAAFLPPDLRRLLEEEGVLEGLPGATEGTGD
ncbi:MAG: hypothetical protein KJ749_04265 [Planctomycetes bacterium]|nr:hypothetical protein [Planctomycetota bacterium]